MFRNPSLVTRIAVGKAVGLVVGLIGFVCLPWFAPDAGWLIRWGVLLWYTTLGGLIGMAGVFTWHPMLRLSLPWWLSAPLLGAWMNFVLTFFAYDAMQAILVATFGADGMLASPWWFTLEGALVGLLIGYVATRLGGEGAATLTADRAVDAGDPTP
jgi:hypothetical protein